MLTRIRYILRRYNIVVGDVVVRVEQSEFLQSKMIKQVLSATLRKTAHEATVKYALEHTNVVRTKIPTLHTQGREHRRFAREFDLDKHYSPIPVHEREALLKGKSLMFLPHSMDVPLPGHEARLTGQILSGCKKVLSLVGAKYLQPELEKRVFRDLSPVTKIPPTWCCPRILSVWSGLPQEKGMLLVQGDKDGRSGAVCHQNLLSVWLHKTFFRDPDHIEVTNLSVYEMKAGIYRIHLQMVPDEFQVHSFARWIADSCDAVDFLAYKEKCFAGEGDCVRTCEKAAEQHECIRRISTRFLPTKGAEQLAARASECIGKADGTHPGDARGRRPHHCQVRSCEEFMTATRNILEQLIYIPGLVDTCAACGGPKGPTSVAHGDSSAMFDEVEEDEALRNYDDAADRVSVRTGTNGVAVQSGVKPRSWLTSVTPLSARQQKARGIRVISNEKTRKLLEYDARSALSRIGRRVLRRRKGVAMGSPQSPSKSGFVYRGHERRFLLTPGRAWQLLGLQRLQNLNIPLHKLLQSVRIADDDLTCSSVLCPTCTGAVGSKIYPPPLIHGCEEAGCHARVIDIAIETWGPVFRITRLNRNAQFPLGCAEQARTRYLPPLRAPLVTR